MSLLESIDIPLGMLVPEFTLEDPEGRKHDSGSLFGPKGLLLIVTCNHCPYARAVWPRTIRIAEYARTLGIHSVAVNPNINPKYPDDSPSAMKEKVKEWNIPFPYLIDADQSIARQLQAQCTPDIYIYDKYRKLVYHCRVDDNWQDESKVTSEELKSAVTALAKGMPVAGTQYPSMGCSIKWMS